MYIYVFVYIYTKHIYQVLDDTHYLSLHIVYHNILQQDDSQMYLAILQLCVASVLGHSLFRISARLCATNSAT
jgi:hypothetical protein